MKFKGWRKRVGDLRMERSEAGFVSLCKHAERQAVLLTPAQARMLYVKLSGDYKD